MSVMIKGMEMPENCTFCEMWHNIDCHPYQGISPPKSRPAHCPLVSVQPHGDLIEKSVIEKAINDACAECEEMCLEFDGFYADCDNCVLSFVKKALTDAPTIIPASGKEKE